MRCLSSAIEKQRAGPPASGTRPTPKKWICEITSRWLPVTSIGTLGSKIGAGPIDVVEIIVEIDGNMGKRIRSATQIPANPDSCPAIDKVNCEWAAPDPAII